MITYRVDVYGSRPIGASLLTTSQFMVGYNVAKVVAAASTVGFLVNEEIRKLVAECERSVVCRPQNSVRWLKTMQTEISTVSVYRIVVNVVFSPSRAINRSTHRQFLHALEYVEAKDV